MEPLNDKGLLAALLVSYDTDSGDEDLEPQLEKPYTMTRWRGICDLSKASESERPICSR